MSRRRQKTVYRSFFAALLFVAGLTAAAFGMFLDLYILSFCGLIVALVGFVWFVLVRLMRLRDFH